MSLIEWHERSFMIELKPKAEFANVFVDCPPSLLNRCPHVDENRPPQQEVVKVGEHLLELGDCTADEDTEETHHKFVADLADLCLFPNTICGLTWADHRRLFMCKVHAEPEGMPLVPKTFHRLTGDIRGETCLDEFVFDARAQPLVLQCAKCDQSLFADRTGQCELVALGEEEFLDVGGLDLEFFCREQCGHGSPNRTTTAPSRCVPSACPSRVVLSESFCLLCQEQTTSICPDQTDSRLLHCFRCRTQIGRVRRSDPSIFELYHSVTHLRTDQESATYLSKRFGSLERYYAWLLMSQCDTQSSLKLIVRSFDKRPHLLIWLLESYVVLTNGDLRELEKDEEKEKSEKDSEQRQSEQHPSEAMAAVHDGTHSFAALKMLYKVFDPQSALSDPRANGQDASVGLVDQPEGSCVRLTELLLTSSHALPPACRSVGLFYVGFLKLNDSIA